MNNEWFKQIIFYKTVDRDNEYFIIVVKYIDYTRTFRFNLKEGEKRYILFQNILKILGKDYLVFYKDHVVLDIHTDIVKSIYLESFKKSFIE